MTIGIYQIKNNKSGRCYFGSSFNIEKRFKEHISALLNGTHHNIQMLRSFEKYNYNISIFSFDIIQQFDSISLFDLREAEQTLIDGNTGGYNMAPATGGDIISTHPNKVNIINKMTNSINANYAAMSKEQKQQVYGRVGDKNPMFNKTHSDEVKSFMYGLNLGRRKGSTKKMTEETKLKLSISAKDSYKNGRIVNMKGATHTAETILKLKNKKPAYIFASPQVKVFDLFCKTENKSVICFGGHAIEAEYKLARSMVSNMLKGTVYMRGHGSKFKVRQLSECDIDELFNGTYITLQQEQTIEDDEYTHVV